MMFNVGFLRFCLDFSYIGYMKKVFRYCFQFNKIIIYETFIIRRKKKYLKIDNSKIDTDRQINDYDFDTELKLDAPGLYI